MNYQFGDIVVGRPSARFHYSITTTGTKWIVLTNCQHNRGITVIRYSEPNALQLLKIMEESFRPSCSLSSLSSTLEKVLARFAYFEVDSSHFLKIGTIFEEHYVTNHLSTFRLLLHEIKEDFVL